MSRWASPPPNWGPQTAEFCYRYDAARLLDGNETGSGAPLGASGAQSALRHHPSQHRQRRGNRPFRSQRATAVCGEGKDGKADAFEWTCLSPRLVAWWRRTSDEGCSSASMPRGLG